MAFYRHRHQIVRSDIAETKAGHVVMEFRPTINAVIDVDIRLPSEGPDFNAVERTASAMDRSPDNFVAFSMVYLTQRILDEDAQKLNDDPNAYTTRQALADTATRLPADDDVRATRMDFVLPNGAPSLRDIDDVATSIGLSRGAFASAATAANAEYQEWLMQHPDTRAYWTDADSQIADSPDDSAQSLPEIEDIGPDATLPATTVSRPPLES